MPNKKITELDAITALTDDDLLVVIDDVAGTPTTKKITKANALSNYLAKDNTAEFIPDANYEPATKKYVDDSVSQAGGGDMLKATYDPANKGEQVLTTGDVLDEDNLVTDSNTKVPTQQSVKAYVDSLNIADLDDFDEQLEVQSSAGRLWGGAITDAGSGTVNIASGAGYVKDSSSSLNNGPATEGAGQASGRTYVSWNAITGFALAGVGYNLIYWDASAGDFAVKLKEDFYANFDFTRDFTIGRVYYDGTTTTIRLCGMNLWNFARRVQMFGEERFPIERATGMVLSETGTRNIAVTAGVLWAELVNRFETTAVDTSSAGTFTYWYRNGSGGWTSAGNQTQINNTQYDDGDGTLGTLTANRYGVHWVYVVHDSSVHIVYGQGDYSLSSANLAQPLGVLPGIISAYATLVGKIIIQKSAASFTSVESAFTKEFTGTTVSDHNDLSGIQGGTTNEYYHLTSAQATVVANTSGTNTGDQDLSGLIPKSLVDAKGDLITATADNTPAILAKGTDGHYLKANSSTATGLEWVALTATGQSPYDAIVASTGGTHTTLAGALADASNGWRILILDGTTETGDITSSLADLTIVGGSFASTVNMQTYILTLRNAILSLQVQLMGLILLY